MASTSVDLGFIDSQFESWELESRHFPSKVGGKPAWLDMKNLPSAETLRCPHCDEPRHFLLQVYAPDNDVSEAFHRTVFMFICKKDQCWSGDSSAPILVLRSQLARDNPCYPYDPPQDSAEWRPELVQGIHSPVCEVCGGRGDMRCGQCRAVPYCGQLHQKLDWRAGHKQQCKEGTARSQTSGQGEHMVSSRASDWCLPQGLLAMEEEPAHDIVSDDKYRHLVEEASTAGGTDMIEASNEEWEEIGKDTKEDKVMEKFKSRLRRSPDQVLRYDRRGQPLLCCDTPLSPAPHCDNCGGSRSFEFQVMPQLLSELKLGSDTCERDGLDWASLYVYTCDNSCHVTGYTREHVQLLNYNLSNLPETDPGVKHQALVQRFQK